MPVLQRCAVDAEQGRTPEERQAFRARFEESYRLWELEPRVDSINRRLQELEAQ